jgi:GAF domain-containing protein
VAGATTQVLAATPILRDDDCLGVISVHGLFSQKAALNTHDHQLLETLGTQLGAALANAVARDLAGDRLGVNQILRTAGFGR